MNPAWTPLLPVALVGTDKATATLPSWPGEVGQLIAQTFERATDPAVGVLRVAGILATCSRAGAQGATWSDPLPPAAADEVLAAVEDELLPALLEWALGSGLARLHHVVLLALSAARRRLPFQLLPTALDLGQRSVALRAVLLPVLGQRGRWLAAQRDGWRYGADLSAEALDEAVWSDGSAVQRRAFLAQERARDPQAARARLAQALGEASAKERADWVSLLADRLTLDDAPLLDRLRTDRSREVRASALALLLRLPAAAHPQRAMARLASLLKHERGLLRQRWLIDAPSAVADDWPADNLEAQRPPHEALGERAWWLYQWVRQVPLGWWTQHLGLDASALFKWAKDSDWQAALLRGWRDVLLAAPEPDWCEAFLRHGKGAGLRDDPATILALLPLARREQHWQQQLDDNNTAAPYLLVSQMLAATAAGQFWSAPLSQTLVRWLGQRIENRTLQDDHALRAYLPELVCALHPDALDAITHWPEPAQASVSFAANLHTVTQVIATRRALQHLTTSTPP